MSENQGKNYVEFGGWLLVWYWCLIIGGIIVLLSMVIPALISIAASLLIGVLYTLGVLVSVVSVCVTAIFEIKSAVQMKARNTQFFDTLLLGTLITLAGGIVSSLLMIRGVGGVIGFISSTIGSIIGFAVGMGLCIMYFSKSERAYVYFNGRPLHNSKYWNLIQRLPAFIIAEPVPNSGNRQ